MHRHLCHTPKISLKFGVWSYSLEENLQFGYSPVLVQIFHIFFKALRIERYFVVCAIFPISLHVYGDDHPGLPIFQFPYRTPLDTTRVSKRSPSLSKALSISDWIPSQPS